MELPSEILELKPFNSRPKIEEHRLIVLDKSTHLEHLSQALQTNNKQFITALTFRTGYNEIFKVTIKNNKFSFATSVTNKAGLIQITIPLGVFELGFVNDEIKTIVIEEGHLVKRIIRLRSNRFSPLGSIK